MASRTIHLVEVTGQGGIYHHTAAVASALSAQGLKVLFHTADDAEDIGLQVPTCSCIRWSRRWPNGVRQPITAARFVVRTIPHLTRCVQSGDLVHVQGQFEPLLTELLVRVLRRGSRKVVWSPHNTFARSGRAVHEASVKRIARVVDACVAFSDSDQKQLESMGASSVRADLAHFIPTPTAAAVDRWKQRFGSPVALLAGQVRADKRPDVFLRACASADVTAALVGPIIDGGSLVKDTAREVGRTPVWEADYIPLVEFIAALTAATVVVATHRIGSVSGPLAMAREIGVRTVAPTVGGLAESVTVAVDGDDEAAFAKAISDALRAPKPEPHGYTESAAQSLSAYELAGWRPVSL